MRKAILALLCIVHLLTTGQAQPIEVGTVLPTRQTPVHDPVMIKEGDTYYLFCTGFGISVWSSRDLKQWKKEPPVFAKPPEWAVQAVPGYRGHTWAPDISYHNGLYYLYYSVSAFGKNTSCIGLATNKTLDTASPDFHWVDHEKVIQSVPGRDMWNAIDPNLILDEQQQPWLVFGSFWNGLKLVQLGPALDQVAEPEQWYTVAARKRSFGIPDTLAGDAAVEAPFIFRRGDYYYLFVSFDYCCRGANSTYKVMVGRSKSVTGPYLDKTGESMSRGGGSLLIEGNGEWYGIGHCGVYHLDKGDYFVAHGYDAKDNGRSKLILRRISWDNTGWPVLEHQQ